MAEFNRTFFERGMDFINLVNETSADTDFDTDWIKLTHYDRVAIVIKKLGATDVDTLGFQFLQSTNVAGSDAKALNVSRYATKVGVQTSTGTWTVGTLATPDDIVGIGSAAPSGGSLIVGTDVNTTACIVMVDIMAQDLDIDGGFDCIAVRVEGDEINEAALISIDAILMGGRFPQATPLSAIA
jgi:hypothetical protein